MGLEILCDTREQLPLEFVLDETVTRVSREKLEFGDYGCRMQDGTRIPIVFERKSVPDLYGSLTSGYSRLRKRITAAKQARHLFYLIVEGSLTDIIARPPKHSTEDPRALVRRIFTIRMHHDVLPVFCTSRYEMATYIKCEFEAFGKNWVRK